MPVPIEKTVFISYRPTNFYTALAVYQDLTAHGYAVFFEYRSIDSGNFEKVTGEKVKARAHFLVIFGAGTKYGDSIAAKIKYIRLIVAEMHVRGRYPA